ncbi:DUF2249 domain-containing protein [Dactylosporangium sp. NPDC049742]|uniref:DUF2249 domain-containing protein n=1 Tax=Dactylosporangium sp. NPDC049742 TaxID=3154737 RepID=UPI003425FB6D
MSQNVAAARAVVSHHGELAATLTGLVAKVLEAAEAGRVGRHREDLAAWLHAELLPHAYAEEASLYPVAAGLPGGGLLVEGMLGEHRAIAALVAELEEAASPVAAAGAARALLAVFTGHLAKENELVLPLLVNAPDVDLAGLLDGMHDLIGGTAGQGCGGSCGCGGDAAGSAGDAPLLSIDSRLDVRDLPHGERHGRVLDALDALPEDGALVLIAPHAPRPLLAEIDQRYAGRFATEWLQSGPDTWQIRLHRTPVPA